MTNDEQGNEQGTMTEQTEQQGERRQLGFSTLDSTLATLRACGHYPFPVGTVDPTVVGAVLLTEALANMAQLLMAQLVKGAVRRHPATIVRLSTLARFMRDNGHGQPDTLLVQLFKQATTNYYRATLYAADDPLAMIQELLAGGSDIGMQ